MKSPIARLYALSAAIVVFFVSWALLAAKPWVTSRSSDPRLAALVVRERRLQAESVAVRQILNRRWGSYRVALAHRKRAITAAERRLSRLLAAQRTPLPTVTAYAAAPRPAAVAVPAAPVIRSAPVVVTKTS
ncbi:MAG: hypothetical protein ACXVZP_05280 [Gaiellaceae bacterium]